MKKFFDKVKTSTLFYTLIVITIFVLSHFLLKLLNLQFRQWAYYFISLLAIIGLVIGTVQLIRKKSRKVKIAFLVIGIMIIIFVLEFWQLILLVLAFSYSPEHIIEKDNNKYVAYVNAFLDVDVYYYDYINFFLVGNKVRIHEYYGSGGYDPFDGEHDNKKPLRYHYYDEQGNLINTNDENYNKKNNYAPNNSNEDDKVNEEITNNSEETVKPEDILYEKVIDNNISIRVKYKGAVLAQRSIIRIEKTTDGGKTWKGTLESADGFMQIHNGAQIVFLDENIGFINDPGLAGTEGENRGLLVTINGGKSFIDAHIIHPQRIEEKNLFVSELPYIEDGILKVKIYTINHNKNPERTYYEFYSEDNGLSWKYKE